MSSRLIEAQSFDPKITYAIYKLQDMLDIQAVNPNPEYKDIVEHKNEAISRYQPIFHPKHIIKLTKAEFESFLLIRNNHHWDSLHRVRKYMTADMELLCDALGILVDESIPVQERLNQLRPERTWGTNSMVSHLGMPVLTAILQIEYPDKYGVWNNTSDAGMKAVRLWNLNWETQPAGDAYLEMNTIYLELAKMMKIDLWTLDALWWVIKKK